MNSSFYCVGFVAMVAVLCVQADDFAKLAEKSPAGFQIQITRKLDCDSKEAYKRFVDDFSKWYDASHSYSQEAKNLSIDLQRHCMLGSFARWWLRASYGRRISPARKDSSDDRRVGPAAGYGRFGGVTYSFINDGSGSKLNVVYNVAGAEFLKLDRIADPVKEVLSMQMDRFQKYCSPPQD